MEANMNELVQKILWAVSFIAFGGTIAIMFFLVFAQSIFGAKTISMQLEKLLRQNEEVNRQLKQITECLQKGQQQTNNK